MKKKIEMRFKTYRSECSVEHNSCHTIWRHQEQTDIECDESLY